MSVPVQNPELHGVEKASGLDLGKWTGILSALAPVWTLLILIFFFSRASETFLRPINLNNILIQIATWGIFATGMTFVLLTGEIDLSIAANAALAAMVSAKLFHEMKIQEPIPMIAALGTATALGFVNGFVSTRFRIPTFMATLAMLSIADGLNVWISHAQTILDISPWASALGSGRIGGDDSPIRIMVVIAIISLLIGHFILRYTRFGRYVYMTGASKSAARLAGVNTNRILIACMTISGFTAGLAGLVSSGRLGTAPPTSIPSYLIDTIGVVVLGGTALNGGRGSMLQTGLGLLIYGTLRNGLDNMPNVDSFMKVFITGLVLLAALIVNVVFSGKAERDKTT
jgi:ribose transport system permease protein